MDNQDIQEALYTAESSTFISVKVPWGDIALMLIEVLRSVPPTTTAETLIAALNDVLKDALDDVFRGDR